MNTGHKNSMTTIHANTPQNALTRLETIMAITNLNLPDKTIQQQMSSTINVIVQIAQLTDGTQKIVNISEITGIKKTVVTMQKLFTFERHGYDQDRKVRGQFRPTGIRPKFAERLLKYGIELPRDMFEMHEPAKIERKTRS
jgi:pilus assembly protein CpaF